MRAVLSPKGQITIPRGIREHLGLKPGSVLEFDARAPFLKAHRIIDREKASRLLGSKARELRGKTVEEWMTWLRGPVALPPRRKK